MKKNYKGAYIITIYHLLCTLLIKCEECFVYSDMFCIFFARILTLTTITRDVKVPLTKHENLR